SGANTTQLRIRGSESNHVLVLIDGIEAAGGDSGFGGYNLSQLEALNIERIEVLRGPQSVFYGSDASAGVVNIITAQGDEGVQFRGTLEAGDANAASAFVSAREARGGLSFSFATRRDKGYDFSGDGGEKDETRRSTMVLSGDYAATERLTLGFTLRKSDETYDYDAASSTATDVDSYIVDTPGLSSDRDELTARVFAEYEALDGRMTHRLAWELTDNDQSFSGGAPTNTRREALQYRLTYALDGRQAANSDQLLTFLLEREEDSSDSNADYQRESTSVALEYRGSFANGLDLQAGLRHDNNKVFDDATTWNLGASYAFDSGVRLHASAGTGVVNPAYFDLYANAFGYTGNPDLQPEQNRGWDLGVEIPILQGRGVVDITYFQETLTDEIAEVWTAPGSFTFTNQDGDSDRRGVELAAELAATEALDLRLSYTWLDATDPNGSREIRRPQHELGLGMTMQAFNGRGAITADLRHVAGNLDTQFWGAFQTKELPDYTTVDVAARYDLTDTLALTGRVTNLFDADAMDVWGYAGRPRSIYVGLDARW
ncbi:MAG: TonB-dependent receptor plug domain-containing protein, partial [Wenzhouxiangella sp.]